MLVQESNSINRIMIRKNTPIWSITKNRFHNGSESTSVLRGYIVGGNVGDVNVNHGGSTEIDYVG